jgi:solute carrier family 25 (mitochondrial folate transporter), member 32
MMASYTATIIGVTATSPIDVLKTRLQVQMDKDLGQKVYTRIHHSFAKIWREEGIGGMFKGYRATVIWTPIFHSIYFPLYEKLRLEFSRDFNLPKHSLPVVFLSCGISGFVSNVITNPMWLIRTRMQAEVFKKDQNENYHRRYRTVTGSILKVYKEEGFLSLYTGLLASMLNITHVLVYFPIYENIKFLFKQLFEPERHTLSPKYITISVTISKSLASLVSYPVELIRARQQDTRAREHKGRNFIDVLNRTYKKEGILAFYSGFSLNLLRILPQNIILFMLYEKLSELFTSIEV